MTNGEVLQKTFTADKKESTVEIKKLNDIDNLDKLVDANDTCYHVKPLKN